MNRKLNLGLSIAAGMLGGFLSHYISPDLVHAQTQPPPPKEIRAQRFVLVNDNGSPAGLFGFDQDGQAVRRTSYSWTKQAKYFGARAVSLTRSH